MKLGIDLLNTLSVYWPTAEIFSNLVRRKGLSLNKWGASLCPLTQFLRKSYIKWALTDQLTTRCTTVFSDKYKHTPVILKPSCAKLKYLV